MIQGSLAGLGITLAVMILLIFVYQSDTGLLHWVVTIGIWIVRLRYCLLLAIAPAAIGIAAWLYPGMLRGLLLARDTSAFWDMLKITMISCFTVGVGLALCRLVELHGSKRFPNVTKLVANEPAVAAVDKNLADQTQGWTWSRIGWWWVLGLVLPVIMIFTMRADQTASLPWLITGTIAGWIAANLVALFVAGLERWLLGHIEQTANAGLLPYEECVNWISPWKIGTWEIPGRSIATWLFGDSNSGFSRLFRGPGYTDDSGVLLPGQAQALILAGFTGLVYLSWYYANHFDQTWTQLGWPSGFFAVVIVFMSGMLMTGVAFWLDRYGLPPIVFAVAYMMFSFNFYMTDHFFEVIVGRPPKTLVSPEPVAGENAYVAAATAPQGPAGSGDQLYWHEVLEEWPFPEVNGKRTLVVVTAAGGGIQAAAWTAKVLTELDREIPGFSQSIGLISSVSGGSVGTMFYVGHRGLIDSSDTSSLSQMFPDNVSQTITDDAKQSSLEAVSWGVAFPDFVRTIAPPAATTFVDRGWALESWWWNSMGRGQQDRDLMKDVTIRDLIPLIASHRVPPVIFNATCVETGQRVLISPLHADVVRPAANVSQSGEDRLVSTPIDFLEHFDETLPDGAQCDLRISTAARLSATFSYVTPVARPRLPDKIKPVEQQQHRLNSHFCDGGYADNPGLLTAVKAIHNLLDHYKDTKKRPPFDHVLVVRIEPFPKTAAQVAKANAGFQSAVYGPTAAMSATRISSQAERSELELRLLEDANFDQRERMSFWSKALAESRILDKKLQAHPAANVEIEKYLRHAKQRLEAGPLEGIKTKQSLLPNPATLAELESGLKDLAVPENLRTEIGTVESHLNSAIKAPLALSEDRNVVPVYSVTFRFEVYPEDRALSNSGNAPVNSREGPCPMVTDPKAGDEPVEPPLTWTLSNEQKRDLDIAWCRIRNKKWNVLNRETADIIPPEGIRGLFFTPESGTP